MRAGPDVEVFGDAVPPARVAILVTEALASRSITDGHVAVSFVDADEIAELNRKYRSKDGPTDVLSFPIDGDDDAVAGPREIGDIVICPEHTTDLEEAVVLGALHLAGMDHEVDDGEMLALQDELMDGLR